MITKPWFGISRQPRFFREILFLAALAPLVLIPLTLASDFLRGTSFLGTDPIKEMEHMLGKWALRFLLATLLITPLRWLTGWNWLAKHRRTLGLFAFAAVAEHLLTWVFLDIQLVIDPDVGWNSIVEDIVKRPYLTIGMLAFILMIPLVWTSTQAAIRRMGKRWTRLHRLVYIIPILGIVHFAMAQKKDIEVPLIYGAFLAALLLLRYWITYQRSHPSKRQNTVLTTEPE